MKTMVEFFCGLGGVSEAVRQLNAERPQQTPLNVVRAIDIDRDCAAVYERNFGARVDCRSIESMDLQSVAATGPQAWWLSPPCQPYCRRGRGVPLDDRRCDAIRAITTFLSHCESPPTAVAVENVPEFAVSQDAVNLIEVLRRRGYATWSGDLCPTQFGVPNLRRRHYIIARLGDEEILPPMISLNPQPWTFNISSILETDPLTIDPCMVDPSIVDSYSTAMDVIDAQDAGARAACFGSGYGKSIIRCGSYLRQGDRIRHFTPTEIARLLGFSPQFTFPDHIPTHRRWKMLGNSVSVTVVKAILKCVFDTGRAARCT